MPSRFLLVTRKTPNATTDRITAVASIRLKMEFASDGASCQTTGSRNFPIGNQPALKANSQIIISPNQGVNTV